MTAAVRDIAQKLGCSADSLRVWYKKAQRDVGKEAGPTSAEKARIKELEREVRELRQANEILKTASAYFAPALTHASMCCRAAGQSSTARSANDCIH
ncbi:Insertion element IS6110 uncharacterized 12.0 kDa protein [Palleronia abyssalis]|uniref:Insertion element IS6110 uncharacterized 12.0 kDa protein n=1 Tax=Palleronia abyssalis TaxID=1501240 RepID=A0A2R8C0A6_9RHOB|nr:Insertion element IS6110 uncharacterized 12.0 kDa protein [Palleronia abyssalis]